MFRKRIITVFLIDDGALIKTIQFGKRIYLGDPLNAVRIFNGFKSDELIFLDIGATKKGKQIDADLIHRINKEAQMPVGVGGGIKDLYQIERLLEAGAEKVVLGHEAICNPEFLKEAVKYFGSSSISVCIDYKSSWLRGPLTYTLNGRNKTNKNPTVAAKQMEDFGAGEIILQSIDRDGCYAGYDFDYLKQISEQLIIPLVGLGGARTHDDLSILLNETHVSGAAASSCFVFHDQSRGVLFNYPKR